MASIRKIEGKGGVSYKITVSAGRDENDNQIRHYKTWRPEPSMTARQVERELQRIAVEFEQDILGGFQVDNKQTFAEYADYVYSLRVQKGDSPQTLERVRRYTKRINEHIGHMKLTAITPRQLNNMYRKLTEPGSNRWQVYAEPAVDFEEMRGGDSYNAFAKRCGTGWDVAYRICNGKRIKKRSAEQIEAHLGRKDLFRIIGTDLQLSSRTARMIHEIARSVLGQAYKEMILKYNPADRVTLPRQRDVRSRDTLQPEEVHAILDALEDEPIAFRALITFLIATGCRRGEALALKWDKVDFETGRVKIDSSVGYYPAAGVYEGPTKTGNTRTLTLPAEVLSLLRRHRSAQTEQRLMLGDMWQDNGYVFPRWNGAAMNPNNVNVDLTRFCQTHNLPHLNPHKFRHTAASILISNGIDVLTVSKMLGHKDTTTTLDIYGHAIEEAKAQASECIADVILRKKHA